MQNQTGPRVDTLAIAEKLINAGDGATVLPTGLDYRGNGFVVAVPEHSLIVDTSLFVWEGDVAMWVHNVESAVTSHVAPFENRRAFGAWIHDGKLYLDVVEIFPRESEQEAIAAGVARNQIAIWDAGRGVEIATGGTGD